MTQPLNPPPLPGSIWVDEYGHYYEVSPNNLVPFNEDQRETRRYRVWLSGGRTWDGPGYPLVFMMDADGRLHPCLGPDHGPCDFLAHHRDHVAALT